MSISPEYLTTFDGEIVFSNKVDTQAIEKVKHVITKNFASLMTFDDQTKTLYIKGPFNNSEELVEKFLIKIYPLIEVKDEVIVKAQGADLKDRWDLSITELGIFIGEYELVKSKFKTLFLAGKTN